jgi:hypothetical protein
MTTLITQFDGMDTLDDRRELRRALAALPPIQRVAFVRHCVSLAKPIGNRHPKLVMDARTSEAVKAAYHGDDDADDRLTNEMWGFLILLSAQWELSLSAVAKDLDAVARGRRLDGGGIGRAGLANPRASEADARIPVAAPRVFAEG